MDQACRPARSPHREQRRFKAKHWPDSRSVLAHVRKIGELCTRRIGLLRVRCLVLLQEVIAAFPY
jgi:hypothetical protein